MNVKCHSLQEDEGKWSMEAHESVGNTHNEVQGQYSSIHFLFDLKNLLFYPSIFFVKVSLFIQLFLTKTLIQYSLMGAIDLLKVSSDLSQGSNWPPW